MTTPRLTTQVLRLARAPRQPTAAAPSSGFTVGAVAGLRGGASLTGLVDLQVPEGLVTASVSTDAVLKVGDRVWAVKARDGQWVITGVA